MVAVLVVVELVGLLVLVVVLDVGDVVELVVVDVVEVVDVVAVGLVVVLVGEVVVDVVEVVDVGVVVLLVGLLVGLVVLLVLVLDVVLDVGLSVGDVVVLVVLDVELVVLELVGLVEVPPPPQFVAPSWVTAPAISWAVPDGPTWSCTGPVYTSHCAHPHAGRSKMMVCLTDLTRSSRSLWRSVCGVAVLSNWPDPEYVSGRS